MLHLLQLVKSQPAAVVVVFTVTVLEKALSSFPLAVAFALTSCPNVNAVSPVFDHAPDVTVVVPMDDPSTYTSIDVPSASVLVPKTDVAPAVTGDETTGAAVTACTVTVLEKELSAYRLLLLLP